MAVSIMASAACASTCARVALDFGLPRRPATSAGSMRRSPLGLLSMERPVRFTGCRREQASEARCRKSLRVAAASLVQEEKSLLVKAESDRSAGWNSLLQAASSIWKSLQTPVVAALLVFLLALQIPSAALAAKTGGRVGGSSFAAARASSAPSRSYSAPSRSYSAPSRSYSAPSRPYSAPSRSYSAPSLSFAPSPSYSAPRVGGGGSTSVYVAPSVSFSAPFSWGWGGPSVVVEPGLGSTVTYGYGGEGVSFVFTLFMVLTVAYLAYSLMSYLGSNQYEEDNGYVLQSQRVSVIKVQVGLLGIARGLQHDLNELAENADTSSPEGLNYLLQETILSLMRHPEYCVYGSSWVDVKRDLDSGEQMFSQLSLEERGKFKAETLSNVGRVQRRSANLPADAGPNEFIVVTILVAAGGEYKLPYVGNVQDLKQALSSLGSVGASSTLAVEVLWTPQDERDCLTARDMLQDFPTLRSF